MLLDQRNKIIEQIVNDVEEWDHQDLVKFARATLEESLSSMPPEMLQEVYDSFREQTK